MKNYGFLLALCLMGLGCDGASVSSSEPSLVWPMLDGGPARTRHAKDLRLDRAPEVVWRRRVLTEPNHYIGAAFADATMLCIVWQALERPAYAQRYDKMHLMAVRLSDGETVWRRKGPDVRGNSRISVLQAGSLWLATRNGLFGFDSRTGDMLRHIKRDWIGGRYPQAMIVESDGVRAYIADTLGEVRCLDLKRAADVWNVRAFDSGDNYLAMHDGKLLLLGTYRGTGLVAFAAEDGMILWRKTKLPRIRLLAHTGPYGPPSVAGDTVLLPTGSASGTLLDDPPPLAYLMGLSLDDGEFAWKAKLSRGKPMGMASDGKRAYVGDYDDGIVCVELGHGRELWRTKDLHLRAAPVVSGDAVLALYETDILRGLSAEDGKVMWEIDLKDKESGEYGKYGDILIVDDRIVLIGSTHVAVLKPADRPGQEEADSATP